MKYLVVLCIAFAASVAADDEWKPITDKEALIKIVEDCKKEDGVIPGLNEDDPLEKGVRMEDICPALKIGFLSLDKGYDVERVLAQYKATSHVDIDVRDIVVGCVRRDETHTSFTEYVHSAEQCISKKIRNAEREKKNEEEKAA